MTGTDKQTRPGRATQCGYQCLLEETGMRNIPMQERQQVGGGYRYDDMASVFCVASQFPIVGGELGGPLGAAVGGMLGVALYTACFVADSY